jgi:hypothetical protein
LFRSSIRYRAQTDEWIDRKVDIALDNSCLVLALGSGAKDIRRQQQIWQASEQGGTSRSIYSAFCDALDSGGDVGSGGAPQLVGIYRSDSAKMIGTLHKNKRYFCGLPVSEDIQSKQVEWRDELFQRIDGETLLLVQGAKRHSRPRHLK